MNSVRLTAMTGHRIEAIEAIPVTLPIEAPVLTCYGSLGAYARNVVRVTTESGLVGYGETSSRYKAHLFERFAKALRGFDVWDTTAVTNRVKHWNYYPYEKPEPLMAALESACLDIQGKAIRQPLHRLLGGKVRDSAPVSSYLFYRHANSAGHGEIHDVEQMLAFAEDQVSRYGFGTLKLKGGYFAPETDRSVLEALREKFGRDMRLRIDPQGSWTPATAIRIGQDIDRLGLEYYEDPCWNAAGNAAVRRRVRTPMATNMCITQFEELYPATQLGAVDVVLSGADYWGGLRAVMMLDRTCSAMGLDVGMHSGAETGIAWAGMMHLAVAMPHLKLAIDCMNLHLVDDLIVGGKMVPRNGVISPPDGPGLGITIDEAKLEKFRALAASGAADDRLVDPTRADSARPGWFPRMPAW